MIWYSTIDDFAKQIYDRGRKDAIDEVLKLLRSAEAMQICGDEIYNEQGLSFPSEWADWLEEKLKNE